jgi:hypothetical protein
MYNKRIEIFSDEAYELGIMDEIGRTHNKTRINNKITLKTCKYCGEKGLEWKNTNFGWKLVNFYDNIHNCKLHLKPNNSKGRS